MGTQTIYIYKILFKDLGVTVPFDSFAAGVLRILEVAPSQLYPNGVATVCNASFSTDSKPLPHYYRFTSKFKGFNRNSLSPEEKFDHSLMEELPRGMSCKELMAISFDSHPTKLFNDILKRQEFDLYPLMQRFLNKRGLVVQANFHEHGASIANTKLLVIPNVAVVAKKTPAIVASSAVPKKAIVVKKSLVEKALVARVVLANFTPIKTTTPLVGDLPTLDSTIRKRKVVELDREEVSKKGKETTPPTIDFDKVAPSSMVGSDSPLVANIVEIALIIPPPLLGDFACFSAPLDSNSYWGTMLDLRGALPIGFVKQFNHELLTSIGYKGSMDMVMAYQLRSMATIAIWGETLYEAK
ncbi:hypothetical protein CR513_22986, partial [Mucuna pruriens]